jgi:UrcA family protein
MILQIPSYYRLTIALAPFLSSVVCLPASAGDQPVHQCPPATAGDHAVNQGQSTTVKFADLDLNTDAGRRELLDRLSKSADRICRTGPVSGLEAYGYSRCYRRTLAAAVDKVHHEQVSALFAAVAHPNTR